MRRKSLILTFLLALSIALPALAQEKDEDISSGDWNAAVKTVQKVSQQAEENARKTRMSVKEERAALNSEVQGLEREYRDTKKRISDLQSRFDALVSQEAELKKTLTAQDGDRNALESAVRSSAGMAEERASASAWTYRAPHRLALLDDLLDTDRYPTIEDIESLIAMNFQEIRESGRVAATEGQFTAPGGNLHSGRILLVGTLASAFRKDDGKTGFLLPVSRGRGLAEAPLRPDSAMGREISGMFDAVESAAAASQTGTGDQGSEGIEDPPAPAASSGTALLAATGFPLDFTNGDLYTRLSETKTLVDRVREGGVFVWPIIAVGFIGLLLALERTATLWRAAPRRSSRIVREAMEAAKAGDWTACRQRLAGKAPILRVLYHTVDGKNERVQAMEKRFDEALLRETPRLERFLSSLNVLAAVAPLLGLLGTVSGIISTFRVITLYGNADPKLLSGGISEALVTTELGLAVAVPLLLLHHVLSRRVHGIMDEIEEKGATLVARAASLAPGPFTGDAVSPRQHGTAETGRGEA